MTVGFTRSRRRRHQAAAEFLLLGQKPLQDKGLGSCDAHPLTEQRIEQANCVPKRDEPARHVADPIEAPAPLLGKPENPRLRQRRGPLQLIVDLSMFERAREAQECIMVAAWSISEIASQGHKITIPFRGEDIAGAAAEGCLRIDQKRLPVPGRLRRQQRIMGAGVA